MKIIRQINNNAALALDGNGKELVVLGRGASEISSTFGLNQSFSDILTGIILFFIIGSEFFITYKISFRRSAKKAEKEGGTANV